MEEQESGVNDGFGKPAEECDDRLIECEKGRDINDILPWAYYIPVPSRQYFSEIFEGYSASGQYVNNFSNMLAIPPASILKQLAAAYETGKNFLNLVEDPLPTKEKSGLSFSAVKSLVLREKDDKSFSDISDDDELHSMMQFLFDSDIHRETLCPYEWWIWFNLPSYHIYAQGH